MLVSNEMVPPVSTGRSIRDEASFMQSGGYFRDQDQAALCLEIAGHISDSRWSKNCARVPQNILRVRTKVARRTEIANSGTA